MFPIAQTMVARSFILISLITLLLPPCPVQAAGGWVLTQRSKDYGDQYVYLSPTGVKCVNPRQGVGLVTRAPNWDISFYNDKTKLYYSLTLNNWKRKVARRQPPSNLSWHKAQSGHIAGLKATEFTMTNPNAQSAQGAKWLSADCWVADDIRVPPQLAEMLATTYGLPTTHSVPLRITYQRPSGRSETILDTYQQQSTAVPDNFLTAPGGYQLAKSEMDVMMTDENKQLVNDIARDLGREPPSLTSTQVPPTTVSGPGGAINVPNGPVTLPNGQTISRERINQFVDAYKQYKQQSSGR